MHKLQNIMAFYLSYHVQQGLIMSLEHSTLLWGFSGSISCGPILQLLRCFCYTRNSNFIIYDPIINTWSSCYDVFPSYQWYFELIQNIRTPFSLNRHAHISTKKRWSEGKLIHHTRLHIMDHIHQYVQYPLN